MSIRSNATLHWHPLRFKVGEKRPRRFVNTLSDTLRDELRRMYHVPHLSKVLNAEDVEALLHCRSTDVILLIKAIRQHEIIVLQEH